MDHSRSPPTTGQSRASDHETGEYRVEGLGDFVELEVGLRPDQPEVEGVAIAQGLMARLGIAGGQLVEMAYIELMRGGL